MADLVMCCTRSMETDGEEEEEEGGRVRGQSGPRSGRWSLGDGLGSGVQAARPRSVQSERLKASSVVLCLLLEKQ